MAPPSATDAFARFTEILTAQGVPEALRYLNSRTPHRFTGLYRFDGDTLRNVHLVDVYDRGTVKGDDPPMAETYCSIVGRTEKPFAVDDTRADARLAGHPARESVISYCGVLVRDAAGRPFGTLCHFDLQPCDVPTNEIPLMERASPLLFQQVA